MATATFGMLLKARVQGANDFKRLGNSMQGAQGKVKNLAMSMNGLRVALGGVLGIVGTGVIVNKIFGKTAELETQTRSLKVLTGELSTAKSIIQDLQQFAAVTPFTSSELVETAKRLKAFGIETKDLVSTTKRLGDVAGATGAELDGIATAFGQIRAKGKLQQEENLQLLERGVDLTGELRKMYGLTGEELAKAMTKGQISFEAANEALTRLTDTGGKYANGAIAQSDTLAGKLSTIQDGVDRLARRIGEVLTPAIKAIFDQAITALDAVNRLLASGRAGGFSRDVFSSSFAMFFGATSQAVDIIEKGLAKITDQKNKVGIEQNLQALEKYQRLLQKVQPTDPNADRAVALQKVIQTKIDLNLEALNALSKATSPDVFKKFELPDPEDKKEPKLTKAQKAAKAAAEKYEKQLKSLAEASQAFTTISIETTGVVEEQATAFDGVKQAAANYLDGIGTLNEGVTNLASTAFKGLEDALTNLVVKGKANFQDFARTVLAATARMIIQQTILATIMRALGFGGGPPFKAGTTGLDTNYSFGPAPSYFTNPNFGVAPFAKGGIFDKPTMFAYANGGYGNFGLLGEKGPEAILPLKKGKGGKLGVAASGGMGDVIVNVDASGSAVEGESGQAKALGAAIGAAVQSEIIKQKKPGGLLY